MRVDSRRVRVEGMRSQSGCQFEGWRREMLSRSHGGYREETNVG